MRRGAIKRHGFHVFVWRTVRPLIKPWLEHKFNYTPEVYTGGGPYLILANHNTDWDPLLLALALPEQTYFVASEHIFRWGLVGRAIRFLVDPIARVKGSGAGDTVLTVMRRLKAGANVAIFAEGNRSFNGLTGDIIPSTGKLARACGATLITYRFKGGYLTSPRWCGSRLRRGKMTGKIVHTVPREQLRAMTKEQVNDLIREDLFEDAYATQRREMVPFRGKDLAEGLETVLCLCPKCGKLGSLRTRDDRLFCGCGFSVRYNEYGFFEGEDAPFDNITDWDASQTEKLLAALPEQGMVYSDGDVALAEVLAGHRDADLGRGMLELYRDKLVCCGRMFPLDKLAGAAMRGALVLSFSCEGHDYDVTAQRPCCVRKYLLAIQHLTGR